MPGKRGIPIWPDSIPVQYLLFDALRRPNKCSAHACGTLGSYFVVRTLKAVVQLEHPAIARQLEFVCQRCQENPILPRAQPVPVCVQDVGCTSLPACREGLVWSLVRLPPP